MKNKLSLFFIGFWLCQVNAKEPEKEKKIQPLSEQFLLFLAEMEEVEGELVHPVDLTAKKLNDKTKLNGKEKTKDGKQKDDN